MSDSDSRDDGKVGSFLLGFIVGVLVCLTGGGVFFMVQQRRLSEQTRMMMMEAEAVRARAEAERKQALEAVQAEKRAKPKE